MRAEWPADKPVMRCSPSGSGTSGPSDLRFPRGPGKPGVPGTGASSVSSAWLRKGAVSDPDMVLGGRARPRSGPTDDPTCEGRRLEATQSREVRAQTGSTERGWDEARARSCLPVPADTPREGEEWNSGDGGDRGGLRRVRSFPPRQVEAAPHPR